MTPIQRNAHVDILRHPTHPPPVPRLSPSSCLVVKNQPALSTHSIALLEQDLIQDNSSTLEHQVHQDRFAGWCREPRAAGERTGLLLSSLNPIASVTSTVPSSTESISGSSSTRSGRRTADEMRISPASFRCKAPDCGYGFDSMSDLRCAV